MGYHWYLTRHTSFYANWPPGHEILTALVLHLAPDPAWAGRLLSLVAGTAAVPLLHRLTARLFGGEAAVVAAALLALNPIHAALSATSLSDTLGLAAMLGLLVAAYRLAETPRSSVVWLALTGTALLATSTRFELWLVLPILVLHNLARTRSLAHTALAAAAVSLFPALWLAERASRGGMLAAYDLVARSARFVGAAPVDLASAAANLGDALAILLGSVVVWLAPLGLVALLLGARPVGRRADRIAWLALLAAFAAFFLRFAADRGTALLPRYVLVLAVLLLPAAALALAACLRPRPVARAGATLAAVAMLYVAYARDLDLHLVKEVPAATREAGAWLSARPADERILITRMAWQSSYLPVAARLEPERYRIISDYLPDEQLRDFARQGRPTLIVTRDTDADQLLHVCRVTGLRARTSGLVARFGRIAVLALEPAPCDAPG